MVKYHRRLQFEKIKRKLSKQKLDQKREKKMEIFRRLEKD
jgi:hypothetical protein